MVLQISQETFNEAVKENVDLLGMTFEEALNEAIKQFEAQNIDLSNISKVSKYEPIDESSLKDSIKKLEELNNTKGNCADIVQCLNNLKDEITKGMEYKICAGKNGAYEQILTSLKNNQGNKQIEMVTLGTLLALMTKQPDLLDDTGVEVIISHLNTTEDTELLKLCLKLAKECCILHEKNRQKLYEANILSKVKPFLEQRNSDVLREILALFRTLILDDDVRVEFGRAHEHARGIASETLPVLVQMIGKFKNDENLANDLILTVSNLLVRNEFCKDFTELGGIDLIRELLTEYGSTEKITRQCYKLIKALAGNDDSKNQIISKGLGPLIIAGLEKNNRSVPVTSSGLSCVAALCLRSPENSKILYENGIADVIIQIMKMHAKEKSIQKTGSWAIRNMVSRSHYQRAHFLELGAEEILKEGMKNFKDCTYHLKAALRDLGCEIEFKEEWTGKGGFLN